MLEPARANKAEPRAWVCHILQITGQIYRNNRELIEIRELSQMARIKLNRPLMPFVVNAKKLGSGELIGDYQPRLKPTTERNAARDIVRSRFGKFVRIGREDWTQTFTLTVDGFNLSSKKQ